MHQVIKRAQDLRDAADAFMKLADQDGPLEWSRDMNVATMVIEQAVSALRLEVSKI